MSPDAQDHSVMMATASDRAEAETLARLLIERKLAACVQLLPIDSFYMWNGRIEHGSELLMLIKTRLALVERAVAALKAAHAYEIPEIVALPIAAGLPAYLKWIDEVTA
jgi:periplasmic divalent cation tolerance protein